MPASPDQVQNPLLYQLHTRDWLKRCGCRTLDEVPGQELDRLAALGLDWLWLLGVWQTGQAGRSVSRANPEWRRSFEEALPDLREEDIVGSTFAITSYSVHADFGGDFALARLRDRLSQRGIRLLLDFVPNHTALDHAWVAEHPDFYIAGNESDLAREPFNFARVGDSGKTRILAYGRDPNFAGWPDTLQLDYRNPEVQAAMLTELSRIAVRCDGVRCDMAMLLLPGIFHRTWGGEMNAFWPKALAAARAVDPDFLFLAEVYWGLEWELQQQGFNYTYDKTLYDRLLEGSAPGVKSHLKADAVYQSKSARFLENHDEPRIAAQLPAPAHHAAAVIAFLVPGMRLLHDGQLEGFRRKPSIHLARRLRETPDREIESFYKILLECLRDGIGQGAWQLLETRAAWEQNPTWDDFVSFLWRRPDGTLFLPVVNYAPHASQCYLPLPHDAVTQDPVRFSDRLGPAIYVRSGEDVAERGLYLDLPPWGCHLFELS
ncbi:MAG: alpha-amylase family glycosyl hydrolase [Acidobacteriota bacterium]|nr:alpha-amylase family glycosyl hydrolase [Acidobacteriota bacterium]